MTFPVNNFEAIVEGSPVGHGLINLEESYMEGSIAQTSARRVDDFSDLPQAHHDSVSRKLDTIQKRNGGLASAISFGDEHIKSRSGSKAKMLK